MSLQSYSTEEIMALKSSWLNNENLILYQCKTLNLYKYATETIVYVHGAQTTYF